MKHGLNYIPKIVELKTEFQKRLSDFKLYESELTLFSSPFSSEDRECVQEALQMEVIDLQCNTVLKPNTPRLESLNSINTSGAVTPSTRPTVPRSSPCLGAPTYVNSSFHYEIE